jgi:NAD(P)-dependent dehydrogenase (short-subunit alcohol dehydrogenase family)
MSEHRLDGKAAIVTGGAAGIGRAIAEALAGAGAAVAIADLKGADEAAAALRGAGRRAVAITADVGTEEDCARLVAAAAEALGRVDVLVNNAGIAMLRPFLDLPPAGFERVMRVNVTGALVCAQHAARRMIAQGGGGRIVNIASISGQRAGSGRTAYGTSKAALIQLTRQMALELAPHRITANAIAPGPVETDMVKTAHTPAQREAYSRLVPLGRYGTPAEIAAAALYLASDAASYVTGHVLDVDGGFMAAGLVVRE